MSARTQCNAASRKAGRQGKKSRSGIPAGDDVVFIGGIPREATQSDLRMLLQTVIGGVNKVRFVIDHSTRHHKGFGFARFSTAAQAKQAVALAKAGSVFTHGKALNIGFSYETCESDSSGTCGLSHSDAESMREDCPELVDEDELPQLVDEDVPEPQPQFQQVQPQMRQPMQVQAMMQQLQQPMLQVPRPMQMVMQPQMQQMAFQPVMNYIVTPQGLRPAGYPQMMPMQC